MSNLSGRICTRELEKEALKNDWTIETNRGGRRIENQPGRAKREIIIAIERVEVTVGFVDHFT